MGTRESQKEGEEWIYARPLGEAKAQLGPITSANLEMTCLATSPGQQDFLLLMGLSAQHHDVLLQCSNRD